MIFLWYSLLAFLHININSASTVCEENVCHNGGTCIEDEPLSYICLCPCQYTGKHCEFQNICANVSFSNVGCFAKQSAKIEGSERLEDINTASDHEWNQYLNEFLCQCALGAKTKGYRRFSLGEQKHCNYYVDDVVFNLDTRVDDGCNGGAPNRNECNDDNGPIACIGSLERDYVYELSGKYQHYSQKEKTRSCADFDYVARFTSTLPEPDNVLGYFHNAFPTGSFTYCVWIKASPTQPSYFLISYASCTNANHFMFWINGAGIHYSIANYLHDITYNTTSFHDTWVMLCSTIDVISGELLSYKDGILYDSHIGSFGPLEADGLLAIGRDQDKYGGGLQNDGMIGEITSFNVWDFVLTAHDIREKIYQGTGTEIGNHLAWPDMRTYVRGAVHVQYGSPLIKWERNGCHWLNLECDPNKVACAKSLYHCPYTSDLSAPKSCANVTKPVELKECSDFESVLEFPAINPGIGAKDVFTANKDMSLCSWFKLTSDDPSSYHNHNLLNLCTGVQCLTPYTIFYLRNNQYVFSRFSVDASWNANFHDETWRHFCLIVEYEQVKLYQGGINLGTRVVPIYRGAYSWPTKVIVGAYSVTDVNSMVGMLARYNIWDYAIPHQAVSALANNHYFTSGNVLNMPLLESYASSPILVKRLSTYMNWKGPRCKWSDSFCVGNQLCEGSTWKCSNISTEGIKIEECVESTYLPEGIHPRPKNSNDYVNVELVSREATNNITHGSVTLNGKEIRTPENVFAILTLNAMSGVTKEWFECDVSTDSTCDVKIGVFLDQLPMETIVFMVLSGPAPANLSSAIPGSLVKSVVQQPSDGGSFVALGYRGHVKMPWANAKDLPAAEGPSVARATIHYVRESCLDHLYMGERENGDYVIYPDGATKLTVFCDFTINGGGWTMIQRRHEQKVAFGRSADSYRRGFGDVSGEFWLGTSNIQRMGRNNQLLVFTHYTGDNDSRFDMYTGFSVRPNLDLDVYGHSGSTSQGIFETNSGVLAFFDRDSACVSEGDGSWWFGSSCAGQNLNQGSTFCQEPRLVRSEMMIRPRIFSQDIFIKRVPRKTSYEEAMDFCFKSSKRLCTASEICREHKKPYGGVRPAPAFIAVADDYNHWIRIDEEGTCDPEVKPSWGDNDQEEYSKDELFCCGYTGDKDYLRLESQPSWTDGRDLCRQRNKRLCHYHEICINKKEPFSGWLTGDHVVPYGNVENQWINIGQSGMGSTHCEIINGNLMSFSDASRGYVFCCPDIPKDHHMEISIVSNALSYAEYMGLCAEKDKRLCHGDEVCRDGIPFDGVKSENVWVPVIDNYNSWMSIGTHNSGTSALCVTHRSYLGASPGWGLSGAEPYKKYLMCCSKSSEGRVRRNWKYDLVFNKDQSHVRFPKITPLSSFTICWWMLLKHLVLHWHTFIIQRSLDFTREQFFFSYIGRKMSISINEQARQVTIPAHIFDENEYHFWCVSWNGAVGQTSLYVDGAPIKTFSDHAKDEKLHYGTLVIGQRLTATGQFREGKNFEGRITRLNMWDSALSASTIHSYSVVCGEEEGNVIAWPEVKLWSSQVDIELGDKCFPASCSDYVYRNKKTSGLYRIKPMRNDSSILVYCDLSKNGGGWTVVGRRINGLNSFETRNWYEYKNGFGSSYTSTDFWLAHDRVNPLTDFWLGHEDIHHITMEHRHQLIISARATSTENVNALYYKDFMLESERDFFSFRFSDVRPESRSEVIANQRRFMTSDENANNCAVDYGPYWYSNYHQHCRRSNIFGTWNTQGIKGIYFLNYNEIVGDVFLAIRTTQEYGQSSPVIYDIPHDSSWYSAKEYCRSKDAYLCSEDDLCRDGSLIHYRGSSLGVQKVPISDNEGLYLGIESSPCSKQYPADGMINVARDYKRMVFCCEGFVKRDWRYDIGFSGNGYVEITDMTASSADLMLICWWLRISRRDLAETTTFLTFLTESDIVFQVSFTKEGIVTITQLTSSSSDEIKTMTDSFWHHYCLARTYVHNTNLYFDGLLQFSTPDTFNTFNNLRLIIGQGVNSTGGIVPGTGLKGTLSRFNIWQRSATATNILEMARECGNDVGNVIRWPDLKYWIHNDAEIIEETSCTDKYDHAWFFNDTARVSHEDFDSMSRLNFKQSQLSLFPSTIPLTLDEDVCIETDVRRDNCLINPSLCSKYGMSVSMWLKRKGFVSGILPETDKYYENLMKWLDERVTVADAWLSCYTSNGDDYNVTDFHTKCDFKGPTLTLVKVGASIFGGFSNENWGGTARHLSSHSSFLFSLYNPDNTGPVKMEVMDQANHTALYINDDFGPTFGENYDLKIGDSTSSVCCSSNLGQTYHVPSGYTQGTNEAKYFFTSTEEFSIDEIEVYYAHAPSEAVGMADETVVEDSQFSASSDKQGFEWDPPCVLHDQGGQCDIWSPIVADILPWIQVELTNVTRLGAIAARTKNVPVRFKLSYSIDGTAWDTYMENLSEKIHKVDTALFEKQIFSSSMDARFVKIVAYSSRDDLESLQIKLFSSDNLDNPIAIPGEKVMTSSERGNRRPSYARLSDRNVFWKPATTDIEPWLQIDLVRDEILTHIATMPKTGGRIERYLVHFSTSNLPLNEYMENGKPRIFHGYLPNMAIVKIPFLKALRARVIRLCFFNEYSSDELSVQMELYRSSNVDDSRILGSFENDVRTGLSGISLHRNRLNEYVFAVKPDHRTWEFVFNYIPTRWTHYTFSWSTANGIKFYKNGLLVDTAATFSIDWIKINEPSKRLYIGKRMNDTSLEVFQLSNLMVIKRQLYDNDVYTMLYEARCNVSRQVHCLGIAEDLLLSKEGTPSQGTGPTFSRKTFPAQSRNMAFLESNLGEKNMTVENGVQYKPEFAVDGNMPNIFRPDHTKCFRTTSGGWIQIKLAKWQYISLVRLYQPEGYDKDRVIPYRVTTSRSLDAFAGGFILCTEVDETANARSFRCKPIVDIKHVRVQSVNNSIPLVACEITLHEKDWGYYEFVYLESSFPKEKGAVGYFNLSTRVFGDTYNCLSFYYHMYGNNTGRLNVYQTDGALMWRLNGEQGHEWRLATVKLREIPGAKKVSVLFQAIAGDGYRSDIAISETTFTVNSKCRTWPASARPKNKVIAMAHTCRCVATEDDRLVVVSRCDMTALGFTWVYNQVLKYGEKCVKPSDDVVLEGTPLVLSTACSLNESAFRFTPTGAIQHRSTQLCVQPLVGFGITTLVLGEKACDYIFWQEVDVLVKDAVGFVPQTMLMLASDNVLNCNPREGLVPFNSGKDHTIFPSNRVFALDQVNDKFLPATVHAVMNDTLLVSIDGSHANTVVDKALTSLMPVQPLRGSVIVGSSIEPRSTLNSWASTYGIYSEYWQTCGYRWLNTSIEFNCNNNEPTLLLIRKGRTIVGGLMNAVTHDPTKKAAFLFLNTATTSVRVDAKFVASLGNHNMSFVNGDDELSIDWSGEDPLVVCRLGNTFDAALLTEFLGEQYFTPSDFEVLQPKDQVECVPDCMENERCDQIIGKCACVDFMHRPPQWCKQGVTRDSLYNDTDHYWSMDMLYNIFDHKSDEYSWGLVDGNISSDLGVNGPSVQLHDNTTVELLSDNGCFDILEACSDTGVTVSFWFKNKQDGNPVTDGLAFLRTGSLETDTGFYMIQQGTSEDIVFERRQEEAVQLNTLNVIPNIWTHFTFSYDASNELYFHINGDKVEAVSNWETKSFVKDGKGKLVIGNGVSDYSTSFDDVSVWYRPLTDEEINRVYKYYYKEKEQLLVQLTVGMQSLTWNPVFLDEEDALHWTLQSDLATTVDKMFPGVDYSYSIHSCRDDSHVVCNLNLTLNGTEYALVRHLEEPSAVPQTLITDMVTLNVVQEEITLEARDIEFSNAPLHFDFDVCNLCQGYMVRYLNNKTGQWVNHTTLAANYTSYNLTGLTGFTLYTVQIAVFTLAGLGRWSDPITFETLEDVPSLAPTNLTGHNASSTEIVFEWEAVELEDIYESLRGYVIYLTEAHNSSHIIQNITTDANTLSVTFDNLRKFSTYTVYVRAMSVDVGNKSIEINITTAEDVPDGPPQNLTGFNRSSTSIRLDFRPVSQDLINGILRGYRLFYFKTREGNDTRKNLTIQERASEGREKRSVDEYYDNYPLFVELTGLDEYTNYTFQIQAITIGPGVLSPPSTIMTDEDVPSVSPPNITAVNTSSTSILLEWRLMAEEDMNGVLLGYIIYYNTSMNGDESSFLHISSNFSAEITGLEKYTIYGFQMTAFTRIGEGPRSPVLYCTTDEDVPSAPPQEIQAVPTSRIKMAIYWKAVPFPFQHGKILGYHFIFSTMSGEVIVNKILPPDQMLIHVSDLDIFTNYTVNVTAFNSKGNGTWGTLTPTSFQLAPIVAPLNLTARSFSTNSSLPLSWVGVPANLTQGYILGYKIYLKLISVGLEKVYNQRERIIDLKGSHHSSYVIEGLDYFSEYGMYVVAYTIQGESPRSNYVHAETCRCEKVLSSQWRNVAPYTNITEAGSADAETIRTSWGIFPYIINDIIQFCCRSCDTHNQSSVDYENNGHRQQSEFFNDPQLNMAVDDVTDITFPVYGYEGMTMWRDSHPFLSLVVSPGTVYIVKKEEVSSMLTTLISNIFGNWSVLLLMLSLAMAAGAIVWLLEFRENPDEYSPNVLRGIGSGFWWAYVSMTTVGYGDKTARSVPGRIFAIMWVLTGLVITGIMIGNLASSLTVSVSSVEKIIYGANVGALSYSPSHRLGVRMNAKMNVGDRQYLTNEDLQKALLSGEVEGILVDGYMVGEYDNLYKHPKLMLNRIKDFKSSYGIVWSGKSKRLSVCLKWYMAQRKTFIFSHIERNLNFPKKIAQLDMSEEMSDLFDPSNELFQKTIKICLLTLAVFLVLGSIYEFVRRKRSSAKVLPGSIEQQNMKRCKMVAMKDYFNKSLTDINDKLVNLKRRHVKQLGRLL